MEFQLEPDNRGADDETLLNDLRDVALSLGKDFVTKDEYNERGRWCASTFQKRFRSWSNANELAGLRKIRNFDATAEDCVKDLEQVAKTLATTFLTMNQYNLHGTFSAETVRRRCGSWISGLKRAGLAVAPTYNEPATDEQLFENLGHLWEALGRRPKRSDFVKPVSRYGYDRYPGRFGSFRRALETFVASLHEPDGEEPEESTMAAVADCSPLPSVIVHRTSRTVSWRVRHLVMIRDNCTCRICGVSPALKPGTVLVVDHVFPWAKGGETVMENLQTLCEPCNGGKSDLVLLPGTQTKE